MQKTVLVWQVSIFIVILYVSQEFEREIGFPYEDASLQKKFFLFKTKLVLTPTIEDDQLLQDDTFPLGMWN